ncbi:hypothetical protein EX30DRAFT_213264 [Ascodesmis nigricans]|uniref:Uncharacterized protein n=1 Tax=Ascodesmis nigricans TaxID=341454 RepID=A0A4S2MZ41_9PEZI|nr:hypothetical protein EX30DRAFT_213264 [Ascodesmis nigricans]
MLTWRAQSAGPQQPSPPATSARSPPFSPRGNSSTTPTSPPPPPSITELDVPQFNPLLHQPCESPSYHPSCLFMLSSPPLPPYPSGFASTSTLRSPERAAPGSYLQLPLACSGLFSLSESAFPLFTSIHHHRHRQLLLRT